MKLFDLIKNELIGKTVYTKENIKFKVECVFQHYDEIQNHFDTKEDIKLTALLLVGKDENNNKREVILSNNRLIELVYFT